jgi:hypothetical protein
MTRLQIRACRTVCLAQYNVLDPFIHEAGK